MGLRIVRLSDKELAAEKQKNIAAIRKAGFRKTADRQQAKLGKFKARKGI